MNEKGHLNLNHPEYLFLFPFDTHTYSLTIFLSLSASFSSLVTERNDIERMPSGVRESETKHFNKNR